MRNAARLEFLAKALKIQCQIEISPQCRECLAMPFGPLDLYTRLIVPIGNVVAKESDQVSAYDPIQIILLLGESRAIWAYLRLSVQGGRNKNGNANWIY